mgnify:CR=1 FL=1|jgi:hypothetical protein
MCILDYVKEFVSCGWSTFRTSSKGKYNGESEAVGKIRREMFSQPSGRLNDVKNMQHDREMVGRDMRAGFNKIVLSNG